MAVRIGITCNQAGFENRLSMAYVRAVARTGAIPLLIPVTARQAAWDGALDAVDGLLLSGGGDPDARHYGEEATPVQGTVQPGRDAMELYLANRALTLNIPLLGICRGAQVMAVAAGGTLYQDLAGVASVQHDQKAPRPYPIHSVTVVRPSLLYSIVRAETLRVNSLHHQAVKATGEAMRISALAGDGVVEAVEAEGHLFALGVQWHPEWLGRRCPHAVALFSAFCQAAGAEARVRCR